MQTSTPARLAALLCAATLTLAGCGDATPEVGEEAPASATPPPAEVEAPAPAPAPAPTGHEGHDHGPDDGHGHGAQVRPDPAATEGSLVGSLPRNARLEVADTEHDFGTAIEGEVLKHTFQMKSSGEGDLVISTAKPTCGCTVSKLELDGPDGGRVLYAFGEPIPPGSDLYLTAQLDTKNKHNIAQSKINIFCNDPRQTVTLGLSANLDSYFAVSPSALDFGELSVADVSEKSFTVSSKRNEPFGLRIENAHPVPGLNVALEPVEPDAEGRAKRWNVQVTLGPDAREGNLGYPINLRSDQLVSGAEKNPDGSDPTYGVSVMTTAQVRGLINFEPQYLSFGLVKPGQVVARTMKLTSFDPEFSFGVPKMRLAGPNDARPEFPWAEHFSMQARPSEDNRSMEVELTLDGLPDEADGSFQGRLVIETGHASKPEVAVLFSGVCRPGISAASAAPGSR